MSGAVRLKHLVPVLLWAGTCGMALAQTAPLSEDDSRALLTQKAPVTPPPETGAAPSSAPVSLDTAGDPRFAVLVLDVDLAYEASAWGRRAQTEIEAAAREIEAENKRLEGQLTAEEQALTAERATLAPDAFRRKAEEFDARAQTIRRERAVVARNLGDRADADRSAFLEAALPVVTTLMQERRAAVVLDRRQTLLAITAADVTAELVARMDQTVGAGGPLPEAGGATPEPPATGTVPNAPAAPPAETAPTEAAPAQ